MDSFKNEDNNSEVESDKPSLDNSSLNGESDSVKESVADASDGLNKEHAYSVKVTEQAMGGRRHRRRSRTVRKGRGHKSRSRSRGRGRGRSSRRQYAGKRKRRRSKRRTMRGG